MEKYRPTKGFVIYIALLLFAGAYKNPVIIWVYLAIGLVCFGIIRYIRWVREDESRQKGAKIVAAVAAGAVVFTVFFVNHLQNVSLYNDSIECIHRGLYPIATDELETLTGRNFGDSRTLVHYSRGLAAAGELYNDVETATMEMRQVATDYDGALADEVLEFREYVLSGRFAADVKVRKEEARQRTETLSGGNTKNSAGSTKKSSAVTAGKTGSSYGGSSSYDPYDVWDYDDAVDFADEWEEDFEGWEDAYEYWAEENE